MSYMFPSTTITLDAALRDLTRGGAKARANAARALGDITDDGERRRVVEALLAALDDDLPEVRMEACGSLGELRDPVALPSLIKRLGDGSAPVRQHAAIALGTIGHPDGFAPLADALRDGPSDLRFQAATSLAEIDPARSFEPIAAALADRDPQVVGAAALSLGAIGDARAIDLLVPGLEHDDLGARFDVGYALAELGDPRGRGILAASTADPERAWDAVTALLRLGTDEDAKALAVALGSQRTPPEATVFAAGALLRISPDGAHHEAARRVLLAGLATRKGHLRGLAIEQLAATGGPWAKAPLEKLARTRKGADFLEAIAGALREIDARHTSPPPGSP